MELSPSFFNAASPPRYEEAAVCALLFESFEDVPAAWHELCGRNDLAMDPGVLRVFQRTLINQCRCWGVVVFDAAGDAAGCAALCLFEADLMETASPFVLRWRDRIRRFWPGFGRMKIVFCGLPVPSGSTHLRVREGASAEMVVKEVNRIMQGIARMTGSRLMVFKELGGNDISFSEALTSSGYIRGAIPPMHLLKGCFESFEGYCNSLKSRYRSQIRRSQKKLKSAGFEVLCGHGGKFLAGHFDEDTHRLYMAVRDRAGQKLELMPLSFFLGLAEELGEEALLTLIRRDQRICAFSFAIRRGGVHYNLYSGLDYTLNNKGDLYFNLFYHDLDHAFRAGATLVHLGQTSDAFKSRLGTTPRKLHFFARAPSPVLNLALRAFAPAVFPKVPAVETHDVFARQINRF